MNRSATNTGLFVVSHFPGHVNHVSGYYEGSDDAWLQVWDSPGPIAGPSSTEDRLIFSQRLFANAPFHWVLPSAAFSTGLLIAASQQPTAYTAATGQFTVVEAEGDFRLEPSGLVVQRATLTPASRSLTLSENPVELYVASFRTIVPADNDELWYQVRDEGTRLVLSLNGSFAGSEFRGAFLGRRLGGSSTLVISGSPTLDISLTGQAVATAVYRVVT